MDAVLNKTQFVAERVGAGMFAPPDHRSKVIHIDPVVDLDIGHPETITVTIEPGDTLNEPLEPLDD